MGMTTSVILLRSKDDPQYKKFVKILKACKDAEVELPKEVDDYFGGDGLDNDPESPLEISYEAKEWIRDGETGYEIDIDSLPDGVKTIRFFNSW